MKRSGGVDKRANEALHHGRVGFRARGVHHRGTAGEGVTAADNMGDTRGGAVRGNDMPSPGMNVVACFPDAIADPGTAVVGCFSGRGSGHCIGALRDRDVTAHGLSRGEALGRGMDGH